MFYCDECAQARGWPKSLAKSRGPCEICEKTAVCNDLKSSELAEYDNE